MNPSSLVIPVLLAAVAVYGTGRKVDVYGTLSRGAEEGLGMLVRIVPALVGLLTAVSMFRASGAMEWFAGLCSPVLEWLGIPPETAILMVVRPVSGSGALAAASDIIGAYGPDSRIGRTAAVMLGSTETTFYVLAVYFGACGVRRSRWAIPAAIAADLRQGPLNRAKTTVRECELTGKVAFRLCSGLEGIRPGGGGRRGHCRHGGRDHSPRS